jgi:cell division protein FtsN
MSRDHKPRYITPWPPKGQGSLLPFLTGLVVGLFLALFLYLQAQLPAEQGLQAGNKAVSQAQTSPPKPTQTSVAKPQFDFYTILPEMEVKVPEEEALEGEKTASRDHETQKPKAVEPGKEAKLSAAYILQAGSFQRAEEAERARARLAGTGIAADIQRVVIGRETWYRVRIGPIKNPAELESMRSRLVKNKVNFIITRSKAGAATGRP